MGKLGNISGKRAVKIFASIGYYTARTEGSHIILYNDSPGFPPLSIPNHKELAPGLLVHQIKITGLTVDEFLSLKNRKR